MAQPSAKIRPYEASIDEKVFKFSVGRARMDGLATANRQAFVHPLALSLWVALSCILIQYLNWWPNPSLPWWTYLKPIPSFGAFAVPIMFAIDWYNRPYFEEEAQKVLRRPDLLNIPVYYSRSPASGVWILVYGEKFVGTIAVDASTDSLSDETVTEGGQNDTRYLQRIARTGTAKIATIRHFYVMEEYRQAGVQEDLLELAVRKAFENDSSVKSIRVVDAPLENWATKAYQLQGFAVDKKVGKVGVLGWVVRSRILTREKWESGKGKKEM